VIVHDFDGLGTGFCPTEADPVLVVDPHGVLPGSITFQLLQAQAGKRQRIQGYRRTQLVESPTGPVMQVRGKSLPGSFGILSVEDVLGAPVLEGDDQASDILLSVRSLMLNGKHNTLRRFGQASSYWVNDLTG